VPNFAEVPWIARHIELYETDPEKAHLWDSSVAGGQGMLTTLLLTTTGRKSGKSRPIPLIYGEVDGGYAVIASKGGFPTHPLWYENLVAQPECRVQVAAKGFRARARVATGAERERIWKQLAQAYPPYDAYQERAGERTIPVVVLEPID